MTARARSSAHTQLQFWYGRRRLPFWCWDRLTTAQKPATEQNYLYELDKTTNEILSQITTYQKDHQGEGGGEITVPGADQAIELPATPVSLPQLQRIRRQFITMNRQHNFSKDRLKQIFIDYLNDQFLR